MANQFLWSGSMPLPFGCSKRRVYAGPYLAKPAQTFGVKVAAEIDSPSDLWVPIRDFGVPRSDMYDQVLFSLLFSLEKIARGRQVYVGCRGGIGRTGMYLALLAKFMGIYDPVGYVRHYYLKGAVETVEQESYVARFKLPASTFHVWKLKGTAALVDFASKVGIPQSRLGV